MKRIRIRRIIVRETETISVKGLGAEDKTEEMTSHLCPHCHLPIYPKQLAPTTNEKYLPPPKNRDS